MRDGGRVFKLLACEAIFSTYLENRAGGHDKFYRVVEVFNRETGGHIAVLNWGRIGTFGQTSVKDDWDRSQAYAQVRSKIDQRGYDESADPRGQDREALEEVVRIAFKKIKDAMPLTKLETKTLWLSEAA